MKKDLTKGIAAIFAVVILGMAANAQGTLVPRCTGTQLSVKEAEAEGDMGGKVIAHFVITNISTKACSLYGYPGFVLLNRTGRPMKASITHGQYDTENKSVSIDPKGIANFSVRYVTGQMGYDPPPRVYHSAKVRITPPNTRKAFVLKSDIGAFGDIDVSAIMAGAPD